VVVAGTRPLLFAADLVKQAVRLKKPRHQLQSREIEAPT
jgi:hypothetical protein